METGDNTSPTEEVKKIDFNHIDTPSVRAYHGAPIHRVAPKMGRNDICSLEGKKFKNCCGKEGYDFCKKMLINYLEQVAEKQNGQSS
jgi:hypothetical protein